MLVQRQLIGFMLQGINQSGNIFRNIILKPTYPAFTYWMDNSINSQAKQQPEPFSLESCQSDDFPYVLDSSLFANPYCYDDSGESELFPNHNPQTPNSDQVIQPGQKDPSLTKENSVLIEEEKSTSEDTQSQIFHYRNSRRKKNQKFQQNKVRNLGNKFQNKKSSITEKKNNQQDEKLTKNLLAFAKKPHFDAIIKKQGQSFINKRPKLLQIMQKDGITLEDYDFLYSCQELKSIFSQFFKRKSLYRDSMVSRAINKNKLIYGYYFEVFERNFQKGEFKSISMTVIELQKEKQYL